MDEELILAGRDEIIKRHGPWTDHNIQLSDNVYTRDASLTSEKLRRIVQVVSDTARKPIAELRILDLACLEGGYAIEFARRGASVVAIEGREANIAKARFSKHVLGLNDLELIHGDVCDLSRLAHGSFDVVLCLGILYHLDAPEVFSFVEKIGEVCDGFAVFDTFVSLSRKRSYSYKGATLWGRDIEEHAPERSEEERSQDLWSSIGNVNSVLVTMPSLLALLDMSGFTSTYECRVPVEADKVRDRVTLLAVKGQKARVLNSPRTNDLPAARPPERAARGTSDYQKPFADASRKLTRLLPLSLRRGVKGGLRTVGVLERDGSWKVPRSRSGG